MDKLSEITAVILAGGMGTRLREVITDRPKVLAKVNGRPFLAFLLDRLVEAGIKQVVLCTGYMAEQVNVAFGSSYRGMELLYSKEEQLLGTGGALRLALPLINSDPLLVMNGDSFCDANISLFLSQHITVNASASLLLARVEDISRYGAVDIDETGTVLSFTEKGARTGTGMINAGIYLLPMAAIKAMPAGKVISLEQEVFPGLIGKGLYGFFHQARFIDIGVPSDYHAASAYLADITDPTKSGDRS